MSIKILTGDCRDILKTIPGDSIHTVCTSPPYWGLRSYLPDGHNDKHLELGLEATPEEYVANMVDVSREVRRVLRPDGVCFLNLGDSYASGGFGGASPASTLTGGGGRYRAGSKLEAMHESSRARSIVPGLKPKDLVGIPWRVAFALQADGWWLRSDIIWSKPNPMPESVTDRPTKAHEYIFLLTKSARYFWDQDAVREPHSRNWWNEYVGAEYMKPKDGRNDGGKRKGTGDQSGRNIRSVWTIATQPFSQAHFATFPPKLAETCIKAGTSERGCCPTCGAPWARVVKRTRTRNGSEVLKGAWASDTPQRIAVTGVGHWRDNTTTETTGWEPGCTCPPASPVPCTVLDPFSGAGTTVLVADRLQRNGIGIELKPEYVEMAAARLSDDSPLFGGVA